MIYRISNNVFYYRGNNSYAACGIADCNDQWIMSPQKIDFFAENGIDNITKVCSGSYGYSVYWISSDGKVYANARNNYNQLGLEGNPIRTPTLIPYFQQNNITVIDAACDAYSGFILDDKGRVYSCGYNGYGGLGHGNTTHITNWKQMDAMKNIKVIQVTCGCYNCLMLQDNGSVYCTGWNYYGQLGLGNTTDIKTPTKIPFFDGIKVIQIACGYAHCIALDEEGRIYGFGYNYHGQCGDNTTTNITTLN